MTWAEYFMIIAESVALKSKDPNTKVGAVIVDTNNHIIGTGFNGMIPGICEDSLWDDRDTKYKHVIHAEANAILHATRSVRGATLYCTLSPCHDCFKLLATAGIAKVFYRTYRCNEVTGDMIKLTGLQIEKV